MARTLVILASLRCDSDEVRVLKRMTGLPAGEDADADPFRL
jgi:hypothetical protein